MLWKFFYTSLSDHSTSLFTHIMVKLHFLRVNFILIFNLPYNLLVLFLCNLFAIIYLPINLTMYTIKSPLILLQTQNLWQPLFFHLFIIVNTQWQLLAYIFPCHFIMTNHHLLAFLYLEMDELSLLLCFNVKCFLLCLYISLEF